MNWIDSIGETIDYIEENLAEDIDIAVLADRVYISNFYLQKSFSMLCGYSISEYIRKRRLSAAGTELISTDEKIIDIAMKYGYESADSFSKAFMRFHGINPSAVRRNGGMIKSFAPLKIKFLLEGGFIMDYKIVEKEAFTIMGFEKEIGYEEAYKVIPDFWTEHYQQGRGEHVCGMYGVCLDTEEGAKTFRYLIADNYLPWNELPQGSTAHTFQKGTWAVFPCKGPMPTALQDVNTKIFSEWLPNCKDYEIAGGFNVEMYSNPKDYAKGNQDENFHSEIWIPVKRK